MGDYASVSSKHQHPLPANNKMFWSTQKPGFWGKIVPSPGNILEDLASIAY